MQSFTSSLPLPTPSSSSTCPGVRARVGFCSRHPGWSGYTPQRDHVSHMLVTSLVLVTTTHSFCDSTPQLPVTWRQAWSRSGHKICCVLPTHLATSTGVCNVAMPARTTSTHFICFRYEVKLISLQYRLSWVPGVVAKLSSDNQRQHTRTLGMGENGWRLADL